MQQRASGLSGADRLALEEHLSGCDRCTREAALLEQLRQRVVTLEPRLSPAGHERIIAAALGHEALDGREVRHGRAGPRGWLAAAVTLLAVGAGLVAWPDGTARHGRDSVMASSTTAPTVAQPGTTEPPPAGASRLLEGTLVHDGRVVSTHDALPTGALLRAQGDVRLRAGRAVLELPAGAALRLQPGLEEVVLVDGTLLADVGKHHEGRRFAVRTQRFVAIVLGTRFEVSLQSVVVHHGRVRVETPDGAVLSPGLGAGERFDLGPVPIDSEVRGDTNAEDTTTTAPRAPPREAPAKARGLLTDARAKLAGGDVAAAQREIRRVLSRRPVPALRAEALSLRAEAHLAAGRPRAAAGQYLQVANRFPSLPAAENALFAAARLEAERGSARARMLLERYLKRYPNGRFEREVRSHLRRLSATEP